MNPVNPINPSGGSACADALRLLPPQTRRAAAWLMAQRQAHGLLPNVAAFDSAAKLEALLLVHAGGTLGNAAQVQSNRIE